MSILITGLLMVFLFYAVFLLGCAAVVMFLPSSFLGAPAKAVLTWLPPFLGGDALRTWAATTAEQITRDRLADERSGATAGLLAAELEDAAMHAMLPLSESADRERIVACPKTGQGLVGVTAPEALAIASYIQKSKSAAEQKRIRELARANAERIASGSEGDASPPPCALQGKDHVCCVYAMRPLRCRPLHAIAIAKDTERCGRPLSEPQAGEAEENGHERTVAQGIEMGMTRALKSAGLDANVYELNNAVATALETPDAAERWAKGETVFHNPLR